MNLLKHKWIVGENAFDYEGCCRIEAVGEDLADVFSNDKRLLDEDSAYDNYLHIYFRETNSGQLDKGYGITAAYEYNHLAEEEVIDLSDEEEKFFTKLVSDALGK